jgi:hypothetical protein
LTWITYLGAAGTLFGLVVAIITIAKNIREKAEENTKSSTLFALIQQSVSNLEKGQVGVTTKLDSMDKTIDDHETRITVLEKSKN